MLFHKNKYLPYIKSRKRSETQKHFVHKNFATLSMLNCVMLSRIMFLISGYAYCEFILKTYLFVRKRIILYKYNIPNGSSMFLVSKIFDLLILAKEFVLSR